MWPLSCPRDRRTAFQELKTRRRVLARGFPTVCELYAYLRLPSSPQSKSADPLQATELALASSSTFGGGHDYDGDMFGDSIVDSTTWVEATAWGSLIQPVAVVQHGRGKHVLQKVGASTAF